MKKSFLVIVVMLSILCFIYGCTKDSYTFRNSIEIKDDDSWSITYDDFNGYKQNEIEMNDEGEHTFIINILTNSGELDLDISTKDGISIYKGKELPSSTFEVKADSVGKYIISFEAKNHSGSFDIKWE